MYTDPLPAGITLQVYTRDRLIFSSGGKWLLPLFELEQFLAAYKGPRELLSIHDTAIGKAAAVLLARMGVERIHANVASLLAVEYIEHLKPNQSIQISYDTCVERLLCATESQLAPLTDSDTMYTLLRQRAKLVEGVSVEAKQVTAPFGAVKNLSFSLAAGDKLLVMGENGAGKTTLLKILAGMIKPSAGKILIEGMAPTALPARTIGYIPQQLDEPTFSLSVEEVVGLGIPRGTPLASERIQEALTRTGAAALAKRSMAHLSGGERQKVAIARCLAQHARLLLLDEPTAALDTESRTTVISILRSLSLSEIPTIIVVTHDKELETLCGWHTLRLNPNPGAAPHA
ncbi:MAG: DUF1893 domain-containing protein [Treponema sp.]|nr:DUF1893 domain-containing protein [Treponema sp.]